MNLITESKRPQKCLIILFLFSSYSHHRNSGYLLRLAVTYHTIPTATGQSDSRHPGRGLMDHIYHDPVLRDHARPRRLLRRPFRKKNNFTSWSDPLHNRLDPCHSRQLREHAVYRSDVLRARLRHRVYSSSHVHRRNRYK